MIEEMVAAGREIKPEHVEPDLLLASAAMIDLFWDLHSWRRYGMGGPEGFTLDMFRHYCDFTGFMLSFFEAKAVKRIDNIFMSKYAPPKAESKS